MELVFLGTGAGAPTADRNVQSVGLKLESGEVLLFDCGEGTQHQLLALGKRQKGTLKAGAISTVFVTHLHGDHVFGLPGASLVVFLLRTPGRLGILCLVDSQAPKGARPIHVCGPAGLRSYLRVALALSRTAIGRGYHVTELVAAPPAAALFGEDRRRRCPEGDDDEGRARLEVSALDMLNFLSRPPPDASPAPPSERSALNVDVALHDGRWVVPCGTHDVIAAPVDHAECPCVAYAYREAPLPGRMVPDRIAARCAGDRQRQGALIALVRAAAKNGDAQVAASFFGDDDGDADPFAVADAFADGLPVRRGRKVVVVGDCRGGGPLARRIAQGADVVVHEATLANDLADHAFQRGHATPGAAGAFARDCRAGTLALWHFSSRYKPDADDWKQAFLRDAAQAGDEGGGFPGPIFLASDLATLPIPKPNEPPTPDEDDDDDSATVRHGSEPSNCRL